MNDIQAKKEPLEVVKMTFDKGISPQALSTPASEFNLESQVAQTLGMKSPPMYSERTSGQTTGKFIKKLRASTKIPIEHNLQSNAN